MDFYQQAIQEAHTAFGEQQSLLEQMKEVYSPILAKGPNQEGFDPAEKSALDAQAKEGTAENYSKASRAVGTAIAARGGGNTPLATGSGEQLREEVAASAAGEESKEESQILQADYEQGYREFTNAGEMLATASHELSPTSYEAAATGAGSAAEKTASDMISEENSWMAPVLGAVGALGGATLTAAGNAGSLSDLFS